MPCFKGTRVPIQNLFDFIEAGDPLVEFLDAFPTVSQEQAVANKGGQAFIIGLFKCFNQLHNNENLTPF